MFTTINDKLFDFEGNGLETYDKVNGYLIDLRSDLAFEIDIKKENGKIYSWIGGDYRRLYTYNSVVEFRHPFIIVDEVPKKYTEVKLGDKFGNNIYLGLGLGLLFYRDKLIVKLRSSNVQSIPETGNPNIYYEFREECLGDTQISVDKIHSSKQEYINNKTKKLNYVYKIYNELAKLEHDNFGVDYVKADTALEYYGVKKDMILLEYRNVVLKQPKREEYNRRCIKEDRFYHIDRMMWALIIDNNNKFLQVKFVNTHKILFTEATHPHVNGTDSLYEICLGSVAKSVSDLLDELENMQEPEDAAEDIYFLMKNISSTHSGVPYGSSDFTNLREKIKNYIRENSQTDTYEAFIKAISGELTGVNYMGINITEELIEEEKPDGKYYFKGEQPFTWQFYENEQPEPAFTKPELSIIEDRTSNKRAIDHISPSSLEDYVAMQENQSGRMVRTYLL